METYLYHVKGNDYSRIHEGDEHVPKKRPKLNPVPIQMQSENFEILEVSSLIAENFKSEKLEDELEEIVPFEQTTGIISKAVEAESPNSIMQNPKIPLNGLRMNFNNIRYVCIFGIRGITQKWAKMGRTSHMYMKLTQKCGLNVYFTC